MRQREVAPAAKAARRTRSLEAFDKLILLLTNCSHKDLALIFTASVAEAAWSDSRTIQFKANCLSLNAMQQRAQD